MPGNIISKLFELARLDSVVKLGIGPTNMSKHNQLVFTKAVVARALDALVVQSRDSSGLQQKVPSEQLLQFSLQTKTNKCRCSML